MDKLASLYLAGATVALGSYAYFFIKTKRMNNLELCGRYMKVVERLNKRESSISLKAQYSILRNECIKRNLIGGENTMSIVINQVNDTFNQLTITCNICRKLRIVNPIKIARVFSTVNAFVH
jgi:uncharacterized HAD superfamily protein